MAGKTDYPTLVKAKLDVTGRLIRAGRCSRMKQDELATRSGVSRATTQRLERGDPTVAWSTVLVACWLLDVPSDPDVLTDAEYTELMVRGEFAKRVRNRAGPDDNF